MFSGGLGIMFTSEISIDFLPVSWSCSWFWGLHWRNWVHSDSMKSGGATFLSKEVGSVHLWPGCDDALSVASELAMAIPAGYNC